MTRPFRAAVLIGLALLVGCGETPVADYGDPTLPSEISADTPVGGIVAQVIAPDLSLTFGSAIQTVELQAYVPEAGSTELNVELRLAGGATREAEAIGTPGVQRRFVAQVPLLHGANEVTAVIQSSDGQYRRLLDFSLAYGGTPPGIRLSGFALPNTDGTCVTDLATSVEEYTNSATVCIEGRLTTQDGGEATVAVGGGAWTTEPGRFSYGVQLSPGENSVLVEATSSGGIRGSASLPVVLDQTPPTARFLRPFDGETTGAPSISLIASADDDWAQPSLFLSTSAGFFVELDPTDENEVLVPLASGTNTLELLAIDKAGNESTTSIEVGRVRAIELRAPRTDSTARLELDRFAIEELLPAEIRERTTLLRLDLRPAVIEALSAIQDPERYGVDTTSWQASEWNLWRLLNMTPDTADLRGTSFESMLEIGDAIGLPSPRLLAEVHGIDVTDTFIPLEVLADAALSTLVASHPNIATGAAGEPLMVLTMEDALTDMRDVGRRFGPTGDHPGFISGNTTAFVFEPGFRMVLDARSRLTEYDGIDLQTATKDVFFLRPEGAAIELDFDDPEAFSVVGIVDEPVMSIRFSVAEGDRYYSTGNDRSAGPRGDGFFVGAGTIWDAPPWLLERAVAEAAFMTYHQLWSDDGYRRELSYDAGSIEDAASVSWDRGWVVVDTPGGLGNPPEPAYIWETLLEIAQVRLHDGGLAEGEADVQFDLTIPVGFTADELVERLRPELARQSDAIAADLLGSGVLVHSEADIFFAPSSAGPVIFFRADEDEPEFEFEYPQVGFFADAGLTQRISSTNPVGNLDDSVHHKLLVAEGDEFYAVDEDGTVHLLRVSSATPRRVALEVREP